MFKNLNTNTLNFLFKKTSKSLKFVTINIVSIVVLTTSALSMGFANIDVKAATVNFVATIPSSGTGPFDTDDLAGHDSSATNSIIRSNDDLIFKYVISPAGGAATNVVINHTLTNAIWQETFPFCTNTDQISADKFTLKCVLGYVNSTLNLTPKAWTHANYNMNGAQVTSNLTVTSDNSPTVTTTAQTLTISSNPKYHVIQGNMWGPNYYQQQVSAKGPDGTTDGIMYTPLSSIKIQGSQNTGIGALEDIKGNAVPDSMSFKVKFEDVSNPNSPVPIPTLQSYTWGTGGNAGACGESNGSYMSNLNDVNCTQASTGGDITMNLTGFRSDGYNGFGCGKICYPEKRVKIRNNDLQGYYNWQQNSFVMDNFTTRVWIPNSAISSAPGQLLKIKQTVYDIQVTAPSIVAPVVQTNAIPATPDLYIRPDNTDVFSANELLTVYGINFYQSTFDINDNDIDFQEAFIYPAITGGESKIASLITNQTINPINNGTLCQKWDKNLFEYRDYNFNNPHGNGNANYSFLQANPGIVEYSTAQAANLETAECADVDGPWYSSVSAVPGGKANISKVRTRNIQNIGFNQTASFSVDLLLKDNPVGTIIKSYTSFQSPNFNNGLWGHQLSTDPKVKGGYDNFRIVSNKSVGTTAFELPNGSTYLAGQTAKFKTYNSYFTQPNTTFNPSTATLINEVTLPVGVTYVPGSAKIAEGRGAYSNNPSINPTSVVANAGGTTTIQWTLPNYQLGTTKNDRHSNIVFNGNFSNTIADNTQTTITSIIKSVDQPGCLPYCFNSSNNPITIYKTKDVFTELSAPAPFSQINTPFSFDMKYGNGSVLPIDYDSIVKLKPSGQGLSQYSGTINVTNVAATNGETVYYSNSATSSDPTDPSNVLPSVNWSTNQASMGGSIKAVRIVKTGLAPSATSSNSVSITVTPTGNKTGDKYQTEAFYRFTGATSLYGSNSTLNNIAGGTLSGTVFNNFHFPSVKDGDETGLAGVTLSLTGPVSQTATTNASGLYKFENLPTGTYTVTATVPNGNTPTFDKDGSANSFTVTSQIVEFNSSIGSNNFADLDFGFTDSLAPVAPTITSATAQSINKIAFEVAGACEPLATVSITVGTVTTTSVCQNNSTYSATLDLSTLPDGGSTIKVKQTDQTGNISPETTASVTFVSGLNSSSSASLVYNCNTASVNTNTTCTFTLPANVVLPSGFSIQIGSTGTPSTACTTAAQLVTCTAVATGSQRGNIDIFTKIGSDAIVNTGEKAQVNDTFSEANDTPNFASLTNMTCTPEPVLVEGTVTCSGILPNYISQPTIKISISNGAATPCTFAASGSYTCTNIPAGTVAGTFPYKLAVNTTAPASTNKNITVNPTIITNSNLSLTGISCKDQSIILGTSFTCTIPLIGSSAYAEPATGISLFTTQGSSNISTNVGTDNCTVNGTNLECTGITTTANPGSTFTLGAANLRSRIGGDTSTDQALVAVTFISNLDTNSIAGLTFACDTALVNTNTACTFTLPANVVLPSGFSIQIGSTGTPSTACTTAAQLVTCSAVATGSQRGNIDIYAKIGSGASINTGEKTLVNTAFSESNDIPNFATLTSMVCTPEPVLVNGTITCSGTLPNFIIQPTSTLKISISDGAATPCTFAASGSYTCTNIPAGTVAGTFPYKLAVNSSTLIATDKTNIVNPTIITNANLSASGATCKDQSIILGTTFTCAIPLIGSTAYAKPAAGISLFTTQGSANISTNVGTDNCTVNGTNLECTNISTTAEAGSTFSLGQASLRSRIGGVAATDQSIAIETFVSNLDSNSLSSLSYNCNSSAINTNTTCSFTLPANIVLPSGFSIKIGANGTPSTACSNASQLVTCTGVATGGQRGNLDIFVKIGSGNSVNSGEKARVTDNFSVANDISNFASLTSMICTPEPVLVGSTINCNGILPDYINQPSDLKISISNGAATACTFASSGSYTCPNIPAGTAAGTFAYKISVGNFTPSNIDKTNIVNPTIITNDNLKIAEASCKDQQIILGSTYTCTIPLIGSTAYAEPATGISVYTSQPQNNVSTRVRTDNCNVNGTNLECTNISTTAEVGSTFSLGQASLRYRYGGVIDTDLTIANITLVSNLDSTSLASLTYTCVPASINSTTTCSFTLPPNIVLPSGFTIQIGANGTPSTACTAVAQLVTCTAVATGGSTGDKEIYGKIGTNPAVNTGEKIQVLGVAGADTDSDGLIDTVEITKGTDPFKADTDGDGMPDGWEDTYGFDPKLGTDAALDKDGDGLTNLQEYTVGTDPTKTNSDSKVTTTKDESTNTITDDKEDIDGDGLTNKDEFVKGTDPKVADSDGDTISDGDEIAVGTDPKSDTVKPPNLADIDGDGVSTEDENKAPNNGDSNGDGTKDYLQKNVALVKDPNSNIAVVIESSSTCPITNASFASEKSLGTDEGYEYLNGLVNYTLNCGSSTVKLSWYNADQTKTYTIRKYGPETPNGTTKVFYDYPANIAKATIAGATVMQVTLSLTDGQKGDSTGVDGKIVDPIGLAVAVPKPIIPTTLVRSGGFAIIGLLAIMSISGAVYWVNSKKTSSKKK